MITVCVAEAGAIQDMYEWIVDDEGIISRRFDTYEEAEVFAKTMIGYGFDALITNLMLQSDAKR